jgi:hypothetical protein
VKVVLLVPDAGPLISLGRVNRLDLLVSLGLPVVIVDQVKFEVTRDARFPDARHIERFLAHQPTVHVFETAVGTAAASRREAGEIRQPGQGEAAIAECLSRIEEITGDPDGPILLLFEDSDILKRRFVLPANVHIISTWSFLLGLERKGLLVSAMSVWQEIEASGRKPAPATTDEPGTAHEEPTRW